MAEVTTQNLVKDAHLDELTINTLRFLAVDAVQRANSGHPGMPMGTAPMAHVLWSRYLKHNPRDPRWANRDRFVLSAGHGSMLLYGLLHLYGYDLPMEEIKNFRQWGSITPGHPESFITPGVETTTGPLGQGFANAVGMAMAERHLAATFNRPDFPIVDHFTYGIASDGDMMEGVSHEAASLAGHLGLGKLIFFYDANKITIDGSTDLAFTEDVGARFEAYNWHVQRVEDGNDLEVIEEALANARAEEDRPSLIIVHTTIGYGSPNKADTAAAHGAPLGDDEVARTKRNLGWPEDKTFYIPAEVYEVRKVALEQGASLQRQWTDLLKRYEDKYPELASEYYRWQEGGLPDGWEDALPSFEVGEKIATRAANGKVIEAVASKIGHLFGGSADLAGSNKTYVEARGDFQKETPQGSNVFWGVREHGMASACNGIALHGGLRPYCATFLVFSDYLRPGMRLSALSHLPVIYVYTHDSIGLGEDGPTHQPVEHYMALRAIPNLTFIRPADANETVEAWQMALKITDGPVALSLTRQKLPVLDRSRKPEGVGVRQGAYILSDSDTPPELILIASGSEVQLIVEAAEVLREEGVAVRVVSMPSWELFEQQETAYQKHVLPDSSAKRLAVEAGVSLGWDRYVGENGRIIGLDRFGASGPWDVVMRQLGFTTERVLAEARKVLDL